MVFVSIIVPCYNEQKTIGLLLSAILHQTYPREQMEIVIADGMSTDNTRDEITRFAGDHPELKIVIVDNLKRNIPSGLNRAIQASQGEYIVRLDAHSMPNPEYVARSIANLEQHLGDNVGGVWEIQPGSESWISRSIAVAASHPLGVGDALYRYTSQAGEVDTVPFGAFKRDLVERVGYFDENLLTNEDYDFNTRVRKAGGKIWLDPRIRSKYFARPDLGSLARQYWRYGYWKEKMLRKSPGAIRWRQVLPPVFVAGILLLGLAGIWLPVAHWLLLFGLGVYLITLLLAGLQQAWKRRDVALLPGLPLAISTMHFSWGSAFLWALIR